MQTNSRDSARYFGGNDHTFQWLRLTHEPSPWIGDWCWLLFGLVFPPPSPDHRTGALGRTECANCDSIGALGRTGALSRRGEERRGGSRAAQPLTRAAQCL